LWATLNLSLYCIIVVESKAGTISVASAFAGHQECLLHSTFASFLVFLKICCASHITKACYFHMLGLQKAWKNRQIVKFMPPVNHAQCVLVLSIYPGLRSIS
jgi:hypothetical protein